MNVYEMLSRDNYLTVNKAIMKTIGISETVMLSELCYRRQFLAREGRLTQDGFFYATVEDVEKETTLSDYAQRKILDKLNELGLVEVERRGLPAKRYIRIDEETLISLMSCATAYKNPVLEDFKNKNLNSSALNNNKLNNNTHVSSKDDTFDKKPSHSSARSETNTSGKLFSSEKSKTKKSSVQKINTFISYCQREAIKKGFPQEILTALDMYFRMLAEMNCLLPSVSIAEQLSWLQKVAEERQLSVIKNTISRGWKSLQYEAEANISQSVPSWDTASSEAFKAKTEEQKLRNPLEGVPEDNIF